MRKSFVRPIVAGCALSLLSIPAVAQDQADPAPGQQVGQENAAAQPADEPQVDNQNQQVGNQNQEDQRYEARRVDPSARQGNVSLQGYLATKLMLANKAEIELSQLAVEKAQHPEVKQFAQTLIRDHQQLNERLQQLQPGTRAAAPRGQVDRPSDRPTDRGAATERRQADRPQADRPQAGQQGPGNQQVPRQLVQMTQQALTNHLQMAKQMLQEKPAQEFDMAFVGMQIAKHTRALAELRAMQNAGSPEFQQLVMQAQQTVEQHLQRAKQLAKTLEGDRATVSQGRQPAGESLRRGELDEQPREN